MLRVKSVNSLLRQARARDESACGRVIGLPAVPNKLGKTAVKTRSATLRPNSATNGVIPGTSWTMMTAGPVPIR